MRDLSYMITTSSFIYFLILLNFFVTGCEAPTGPEDPNVDRNIPASEDFDASYGFWGPDGETIYFNHSEELGSNPEPGKLDQLWELNLETGQRQMIAPGRILNADISPDGEWFVFQSFAVPQYLYQVNSDGTDFRKLTGPESTNPNWEQTTLGRWSPDGNNILFRVAGVPRGVTIMNSDGTEPDIIVPFGTHANWFPGGRRIVYVDYDTSQVQSKQQQIYIADADGRNAQKKTDLDNTFFNISGPNVSPNSKKIAFIYDDEVYLKNIDENTTEQLTAGSGYTVRPEWSHDGQTILFSRIIPNVSKRLYYLDVTSREVTPVFPLAKKD